MKLFNKLAAASKQTIDSSVTFVKECATEPQVPGRDAEPKDIDQYLRHRNRHDTTEVVGVASVVAGVASLLI